MRRPEQEFQIAVCQYLRLALPSKSVVFHVPNQGKRGSTEKQMLAAMGLMAGMTDLVCIVPKTQQVTVARRAVIAFLNPTVICIELKKPGKKPRPDPQQDAVHALLRDAGAAVFVANSLEDIEAGLIGAGVTLRTKLEPVTRPFVDRPKPPNP